MLLWLIGFITLFSNVNGYEIQYFDEYDLMDYLVDTDFENTFDYSDNNSNDVDIQDFMSVLDDDKSIDFLLNDGKRWKKFKNKLKKVAKKATKWVAKNGDKISGALDKVSKVAGKVSAVAGVVRHVASVASVIPGVNVIAGPIAAAAGAVQAASWSVKNAARAASAGVKVATEFSKGYQEGGLKTGLKRGGKQTLKEAKKYAFRKVAETGAKVLMGASKGVLQNGVKGLKGFKPSSLKSSFGKAFKNNMNVKENMKKTLSGFKFKNQFKNARETLKNDHINNLKGGASIGKQLAQQTKKEMRHYLERGAKILVKDQFKEGLNATDEKATAFFGNMMNNFAKKKELKLLEAKKREKEYIEAKRKAFYKGKLNPRNNLYRTSYPTMIPFNYLATNHKWTSGVRI
ncbi:hypothetical protein QTN25_008818 [Entamoeba marina]